MEMGGKMANFNKIRDNYKTLIPIILPSLILIPLTIIIGWFVMMGWERTRTVTYVIPPGTNARLANGEDVLNIPEEVVLTVGVKDTLVIENQDNVVHTFGLFTILPHTTLTKRFTSPRVYQNVCTFHENRQMKVVINPAPWDIFSDVETN
jgi:hypothetical protein